MKLAVMMSYLLLGRSILAKMYVLSSYNFRRIRLRKKSTFIVNDDCDIYKKKLSYRKQIARHNDGCKFLGWGWSFSRGRKGDIERQSIA